MVDIFHNTGRSLRVNSLLIQDSETHMGAFVAER